MSSVPARRRQLWRFGLRSLFTVVAVLCCWLAWHLNLIHNRQQFLARPRVTAVPVIVFPNNGKSPIATLTATGRRSMPLHMYCAPPKSSGTLSLPRRWLGDRVYSRIYTCTTEEFGLAQSLFPEAEIVFNPKMVISQRH